MSSKQASPTPPLPPGMSLAKIARRLAEIKPAIKSLSSEETELKDFATDIMLAKEELEYSLPGTGKITLSENKPRAVLDKDALKAYLVERCKLAPSAVDKAFAAATKEGNISKLYRVEFSSAE